MFKVLITDPISDKGIALLQKYNVEILDYSNKKKEYKNILLDIDGWIIRSGTQISLKDISKTKKLQVIGRAGVGIDNIDIKSCTEKGILVMNMPDGNTISAAEHTFSLIAALSRNIHLAHSSTINNEWLRNELVGNELRNKVLGVVGLGKIGQEVIKRAISFEMDIIGYDPYVNKDVINTEIIQLVDLEYILTNSDIITLHIPLLDSTKNLINIESFKKMKPTAKLINVARGGIVNEKDLAQALNNNLISGAAIDVFSIEPIDKSNPLLSAKNILLSPHLGASTHEAKEGVSIGICQQVCDYLISGKLTNSINIPITDFSLLKEIKPYLDLAEAVGSFQSQLNHEPIKSIELKCYGSIKEPHPVLIAYLKGFLKYLTDNRVNLINAESIARERGIQLMHSYDSKKIPFANMIECIIKTSQNKKFSICASNFGNNSRIVRIYNLDLEFKPEGNILVITNLDKPGVVGKIGQVLGNQNINIGEFLLGRSDDKVEALSIIKVDCKVEEDSMNLIKSIEEVKDICYLVI